MSDEVCGVAGYPVYGVVVRCYLPPHPPGTAHAAHCYGSDDFVWEYRGELVEAAIARLEDHLGEDTDGLVHNVSAADLALVLRSAKRR